MRILRHIHSPVDILQGLAVAVEAIGQRRSLRPCRNPLFDRRAVYVVEQFDHTIHKIRGDGSLPVGSLCKTEEVFGRRNAADSSASGLTGSLLHIHSHTLTSKIGYRQSACAFRRSLVLFHGNYQLRCSQASLSGCRYDFQPVGRAAGQPIGGRGNRECFLLSERQGFGGIGRHGKWHLVSAVVHRLLTAGAEEQSQGEIK